MEGFQLSTEEIQELRVAHSSAKSAKNVQAAYKINAVILLGTGWPVSDVSEALLLNKDTLSSYVKKYKQDGLNTLLKTLYAGGFRKISHEQTDILCKELDSNIHLTTKSVCAFVLREFGIQYSVGGMTDLLHSLGYTYKKPKLTPCNPNIDAQEEFLSFYT